MNIGSVIIISALCFTIIIILMCRYFNSTFDYKKGFLSIIILWFLAGSIHFIVVYKSNIFFHQISSGNIIRVNEMLNKNPSLCRSRTWMKKTGLHLAVQNAQVKISSILIKYGADVDAKDFDRITPIHIASQTGNIEIMKLLIQHGANINSIGYRHDETPLHIAAFEGHYNAVMLLLKYGSNVNAENMLGKTAMAIAEEEGHNDVIELLK